METITPYPVFQIAGLTITNTIVNTWIGMGLLVAALLVIKSTSPGLLDQLYEMLENLIRGLVDTDRITTYMPFLGTLIIFIFISNNLSFIPGLGSPSQDINTPIMLALLVFAAVHYFGIREKGVLKYMKDFATPIITFPFEIIGQVSRTISLSIRLFGNVISTELVVVIISQLVPLGAPIIMIALSLLTGTLQAYIFTALAGSYISSAIRVE